MTAAENAAALDGYLVHHDTSFLREDAVFMDMNGGGRFTGPAEIDGMLHWFYQVAFDARFEPTARIVTDDMAALEGTVIGRHTGEFAGVPATGRDVRVPIAIIYRFTDGRIAGANVYTAVGAFLAQVSDAPA